MTHQELLSRYGLNELEPEFWPEDNEPLSVTQRPQSRYSVLQESSVGASLLDPAQPVDEPDPLGTTDSIVRVLASQNIPVDHDLRVRNRYLLSSETFNPEVFIRDVHNRTPDSDLLRGLRYLRSAEQQQSFAMKGLVETNFDRFVHAKTTIDRVYSEMKSTTLSPKQEFGTRNVSRNVEEVSEKAADLYKSVLTNQAKAQTLRAAIQIVQNNQQLFQLPATIKHLIKQQDREGLMREYRRGRAMVDDLRGSDTEQNNQTAMLDRVWLETQESISAYTQNLQKRLLETRTNNGYIDTISILLDLGVGTNPIWTALNSQYTYLKTQFSVTFEANVRTIENVRRTSSKDSQVELWDAVSFCTNECLERNGNQAILFDKTVNGFLDGDTQKLLPVGYKGESRRFHSFTDSESGQLSEMAGDLAQDLIRQTAQLFAPQKSRYASRSYDGSGRYRDSGDTSLQELTFLPRNADAKTIAENLAVLVSKIALHCSKLISLLPRGADSEVRSTMNEIRDKTTKIVCELWSRDATQFYRSETWKHAPDNSSLTELPSRFIQFASTIVESLQMLTFVSVSETVDRRVIGPPSQTLITNIHTKIVKSLYPFFQELVTMATDSNIKVNGEFASTSPSTIMDYKDSDVRLLLTLSNMRQIHTDIMQRLVPQLENAFGAALTSQYRTVYDVLDQLDTKLFNEFIKRKSRPLSPIIRHGILDHRENWYKSQIPVTVSPFVLDMLVSLTLVHAQVLSVSSKQLGKVFNKLFLDVVSEMLEAIKSLEKVSHSGILQVTVDVEFTQQTLSMYASKGTSDVIGQIFKTIERHTYDTQELSDGLTAMKGVMSYVKRSTSTQFACFRRIKDSKGQS